MLQTLPKIQERLAMLAMPFAKCNLLWLFILKSSVYIRSAAKEMSVKEGKELMDFLHRNGGHYKDVTSGKDATPESLNVSVPQ